MARILVPNLKRTHGIGIKATVTNPSREVAQAMPKVRYTRLGKEKGIRMFSSWLPQNTYYGKHLLCKANRGKAAPRIYRNRPFAAIAEAPFMA